MDLMGYLLQGRAGEAASDSSGFVPVLVPQRCDEAEGNQSTHRGVPVRVLRIITMSCNADVSAIPIAESKTHEEKDIVICPLAL